MFGVYAAGAVRKVEVDGTVSFTANNIAAKVEVWEHIGPTAIAETAETGWVLVKELTYAVDGTVLNGVLVDGAAALQDLQEISLDTVENELDDTNLVYQYKIVITNLFNTGASSINVTVETKFEGVVNEWLTESNDDTFVEEVLTPVVLAPDAVGSFMYTLTVHPTLAPQTASDIAIGSTVNMYRA